MKNLLIFGALILVVLFIFLRPVPIVPESEAITVKGKVKSIFEGGVKDVVFVLEDQASRFYINRGLENGLNLNDLQNRLVGKEVIIKYPSYWTPFDANKRIRHLSKLEVDGEVIFDELK